MIKKLEKNKLIRDVITNEDFLIYNIKEIYKEK